MWTSAGEMLLLKDKRVRMDEYPITKSVPCISSMECGLPEIDISILLAFSSCFSHPSHHLLKSPVLIILTIVAHYGNGNSHFASVR